MLARFYYFPIRGKELVIDICGDSNKTYNKCAPICMGYYEVGKRKLNYIDMANRVGEFLFSRTEDFTVASQSMTQIHSFYSCEDNIEMINVYVTMYCGDSKLRIYCKDVLIGNGCLNNWNTDEETRDLIVTEIMRMKDIYGSTYT